VPADNYQIDVTELGPPESVQASCNIHQIVGFKSNVAAFNNGRQATQHPPVSR